MDPRKFYGITRTKTNNRVLALPEDSDDENLSDDDEYQLPKLTIPETDSESDSEVIESEVVYLQDTEPENTEEIYEDINEILELASESKEKDIPKEKRAKVHKRSKLLWTEDSIE